MKIRLTINGKSATATLADNPSARDFLSLLPLTLKLAADILATRLSGIRCSWGARTLNDPRIARVRYIEALRAADGHDLRALVAFVRL